MKRISFKLAVAILAFIISSTAAGLCFIYPLSYYQGLHSLPIDAVGIEEAEEYAVYCALLKELFLKENTNLLIIENQTLFYENPDFLKRTTPDDRIRDMRKSYSSVAEDTLIDFDSKYMQPSKLKANFNLSIKYILIDKLPIEHILKDEEELEKSKSESPTQTLFKKYPDAIGVISLSKVGFNKDKTEAFVRVQCCGSADKVVLERKSGVWTVKEIFNVWVS